MGILLAGFDTETTDLPQKKLPITHPKQPHIVQLATVLRTLEGEEKGTFNKIIKPQGYTAMAPEAEEAHGISFERAMDEGIDRRIVLDEWREFIRPAKLMVAHNAPFDIKLLDIQMRREYADVKQSYRYKRRFCTMTTYTPICKLPPTEAMKRWGFGPYKSPKLQEVYMHVFGKEFDDAHDALADVRATLDVFFELPQDILDTAFSGLTE